VFGSLSLSLSLSLSVFSHFESHSSVKHHDTFMKELELCCEIIIFRCSHTHTHTHTHTHRHTQTHTETLSHTHTHTDPLFLSHTHTHTASQDCKSRWWCHQMDDTPTEHYKQKTNRCIYIHHSLWQRERESVRKLMFGSSAESQRRWCHAFITHESCRTGPESQSEQETLRSKVTCVNPGISSFVGMIHE